MKIPDEQADRWRQLAREWLIERGWTFETMHGGEWWFAPKHYLYKGDPPMCFRIALHEELYREDLP